MEDFVHEYIFWHTKYEELKLKLVMDSIGEQKNGFQLNKEMHFCNKQMVFFAKRSVF